MAALARRTTAASRDDPTPIQQLEVTGRIVRKWRQQSKGIRPDTIAPAARTHRRHACALGMLLRACAGRSARQVGGRADATPALAQETSRGRSSARLCAPRRTRLIRATWTEEIMRATGPHTWTDGDYTRYQVPHTRSGSTRTRLRARLAFRHVLRYPIISRANSMPSLNHKRQPTLTPWRPGIPRHRPSFCASSMSAVAGLLSFS